MVFLGGLSPSFGGGAFNGDYVSGNADDPYFSKQPKDGIVPEGRMHDNVVAQTSGACVRDEAGDDT